MDLWTGCQNRQLTGHGMELTTAAVADRVSYTEALLGSCVSIK